MMKHPKHPLNIAYMLLLLSTVVSVMVGYKYGQSEGMGWQPMEEFAINVYTFIILFCLVSIPTMLWGFNRWVKGLQEIQDVKTRIQKYVRFGIVRIAWMGLALQASVLGYYFLHQNGLIYMTGICILTLFFIKPTQKRIDADLNLNPIEDTPTEENVESTEVEEVVSETTKEETIELDSNNK